MMKTTSTSLLLTALALPLTVPIGVYADPPKTSAWALTFSDEFDSPALDTSKWTSGYVIEKTGPDSWADPGNVRFSGGHLQLFGEKRSGQGKTYAGAAINTRGKFSQLYGYFEVRFKAAKGKGFSSKMTGIRPDAGLPPLMDMVEFRGEETSNPYWYMHYNDGGGEQQFGGGSKATVDLSLDYHLFGTEWNADNIIWYIDGVEKMRGKVGSGLKTKIFFGLELMVGGSDWIGIPDGNTPWPGTAEVDWVHIYQRTGPPVGLAPQPPRSPGALGVSADATLQAGYLISGRWFPMNRHRSGAAAPLFPYPARRL
jgi:beta-glucanase (GH16 family)